VCGFTRRDVAELLRGQAHWLSETTCLPGNLTVMTILKWSTIVHYLPAYIVKAQTSTTSYIDSCYIYIYVFSSHSCKAIFVRVTGTGTQKHNTKTGMQEEAFYLVIQAGSKPGGPLNRATNPKRGRQKSEVGSTGKQGRNGQIRVSI